MNKPERNIYELIYEPETSDGVFAVSLVKTTAVEHLAVQLSQDPEPCNCQFSEEADDEGVLAALDWLIEQGETPETMTGNWEIIAAEPIDQIEDFAFAPMDIPQGAGLSEQDNELFKIRYRLAPNRVSANSREFCRKLIAADKIYRKEDIEEAGRSGVNGSFSAKGESTYDIFLYKGGVYCQHYWERVILLAIDNDQQITAKEAREWLNFVEPENRHKYRIAENSAKVAQVAEASNNYWKMSSEEKRVLVQPILIPDQLIYRSKVKGESGYVYTSAETIEKLQENFFRNNYNHNSSLEHDYSQIVDGVFIFESWIVQDTYKDKSHALGFELPVGSWVVSMKIENDEIWQQVKKGEVNGLSIDAQLWAK